MKKTLLLFTFLPIITFAQNQMADSLFIKTLSDNVLTNRSAYNNLYHLTKKIGGRLAGSPEMVKAEQWGAEALKAAGADKVIWQECMVPHWVRGGKDKATVFYSVKGKQQSLQLNVLALGNSVGSGARGIKAPLMRVTSFEDLEAKKDQLKGKIIFYSVPFDEEFIHTFEAYGKNVIYRAIGASKAAHYGALAVLVRSMSHSMDNNPHTGALHYIDSVPKIPAAALGLRDVEKLDTLFQEGKSLTAQLFTYGKMLPDTIGHNIIGEITGSEFPDEYITVGGHLDSWDVNEGATDDGAGIVQTIEILRAFKATGFKPRHTIRFVLFANEENGTRGGEKYAAVAKANKEKQVFALESDAGGFTPRGFSLELPASAWHKVNSWKPLFAPYGVTDLEQGGGGEDIRLLGEELKTPVGELRPDSQRYFDLHHSAGDVLEAVNIRELKLGAINMGALLYLVDKYGL